MWGHVSRIKCQQKGVQIVGACLKILLAPEPHLFERHLVQ